MAPWCRPLEHFGKAICAEINTEILESRAQILQGRLNLLKKNCFDVKKMFGVNNGLAQVVGAKTVLVPKNLLAPKFCWAPKKMFSEFFVDSPVDF